MSDITFQEHRVKWTEQKVKDFWDYYVQNGSFVELSFAHQTGKDIVARTKAYVKRDGANLDYGCGGGPLMNYLFEEGIACSGLDSSEQSIEIVKRRFKDNPLFHGAILAAPFPHPGIPDGSYDFVYFIETIEHILPEQLEAQVRELGRIVKPGGYIFISTPFNEDLKKCGVLCPDCGALYHRVQHMSSFTVESLSSLMNCGGFRTVFCVPTVLGQTSFAARLKKLLRALTRARYTPHLTYLGVKK